MSGLVPYFKLGKAVRFRVADVTAALEGMKIACGGGQKRDKPLVMNR